MTNEIIASRLEGSKLIVETAAGIAEYDSRFLVAALLVYVARGSGQIEPEESGKIIDLIEERFKLQGAETLELVTRAMAETAENPELATLLAELAKSLTDNDKEEFALMALKVIAADGKRQFEEMEQFNRAMSAAGIAPEIVHRAFDRYFAETMPGQ
ncbi:MAG: TerB family tellurite resistance protein [Gammaproteobacteria bacterium]|nr:TerB family tellurite resistance protein [Gammaproteobacteria bacterium]